MSSPEPEAIRRSRIIPAIPYGAVGLLIVCALYARGCPGGPLDSPSIESAKHIITKASLTPSTIKWLRAEDLAREFGEDGIYRLVFLSFDEQNEYGALVRHNRCVSFVEKPREYAWSRRYAKMDCSDPPTAIDVKNAKFLNEWPSTRPDLRPPPDLRPELDLREPDDLRPAPSPDLAEPVAAASVIAPKRTRRTQVASAARQDEAAEQVFAPPAATEQGRMVCTPLPGGGEQCKYVGPKAPPP